MTISGPRLRSLLRQAERVVAAGKRAAAESLYRQLLEEAPEAEAAWLGLAGVVTDPAERTAAYEQALAINPESEAAQNGLAPSQDDTPIEDSGDDQSEVTEHSENRSVEISKPPPEIQIPSPDLEDEQVEATAEHDHTHGRQAVDADDDEFALVCYRHPSRETSLRCYSCRKPICIQCAVKTPVGYSCPDCLREIRKEYYTATAFDYMIAVIVALPLSILAAYLVGFLGFFVFFVSPVVGTVIGRSVFWAVRRRRGRWLAHLVAGAVIVGAVIKIILPFFLSVLLTYLASPEQLEMLFSSGSSLVSLLLSGGGSLLWTGIYAFMAAGAAYYFVKV